MGLLNRLPGPKLLLSCGDVVVFGAATAGAVVAFGFFQDHGWFLAGSDVVVASGLLHDRGWFLPDAEKVVSVGGGVLATVWWLGCLLGLLAYWAPSKDEAVRTAEIRAFAIVVLAALVAAGAVAEHWYHTVSWLIGSYRALLGW